MKILWIHTLALAHRLCAKRSPQSPTWRIQSFIRQLLKSGDCRGSCREEGPKGHHRKGKPRFLWRCFDPLTAQSPSPHRPLEQLGSRTPLRTGARSAGLTGSPVGSSARGAAGAPVGQCSSLIRREMTEGGFVLLQTPVSPHPG